MKNNYKVVICLFKTAILNLGCIDILGQTIHGCEELSWLSIVGCLALTLASAHWMPGTPPPQVRQPKSFPEIGKCPWGGVPAKSFLVENHWFKVNHQHLFVQHRVVSFTVITSAITVVPPYPRGLRSKTPSGCLKPQTVPNPMCAMFFPIHTYLWQSLI